MTRRKSRGWGLLALAGLPLIVLHLGLLFERAMSQETLDVIVVLRWSLAVALLVVLRRLASRIDSIRSPALGIAAILVFAMIHLPVAAPEPGLPLAATGLGMALSLAVVDRRRRTLPLCPRLALMDRPTSSAWSAVVSRDALKDRAPPVAR